MDKDLRNWKRCAKPEKKDMEGQYVILEPLNAEKHEEELYQVMTKSEDRMKFLWKSASKNWEEFQKWVKSAEANNDVLFFVVIDKHSGKVGGCQTFLQINQEHGTVEIGGLLRGSIISKKPAATEAIYLFLRYIFDDLGYRRFEWKCHVDNKDSARAALRYGFKYEATFRNHLVIKGKNRDSHFYSMIDQEWPLMKKAYKAWLSPGNFDSKGIQKRKLKYFQV